MNSVEKIILVTKETALEELVQRMNTAEQAKFYIEHMGASFGEYQDAHDTYKRALAKLEESIPSSIRCQKIDRSFLPNFVFGENDLVVTLGPDGLVVNTAKYLHQQPLLAFNPDTRRIDGVIVPFDVYAAKSVIQSTLHGELGVRQITMAKASLNDGQVLYAVNDLFIGQCSHVSARYRLTIGKKSELQSSSGIIVSTGTGSSGWLRSILTGAAGIIQEHVGTIEAAEAKTTYQFSPESSVLAYAVREPFISRITGANLVFGRIKNDEHLEIVSEMPQNGVIFSDGIETDYLVFNSGATAKITIAEKKLHLIE